MPLVRPRFSTQLSLLRALAAALCASLIAIIWLMASCTEGHRIASARQRASDACEAIASHYTLSLPRATEPNVELLRDVLNTALAASAGIEGGFWRAGAPRSTPPASAPGHGGGFLAYAFPSYPGSGIKRDIPEAETPLILSALSAASSAVRPAAEIVGRHREAVIAIACPVNGHTGLYAWTLVRAQSMWVRQGDAIVATFAGALAVLFAVSLYLAFALCAWRDKLVRLDTALSSDDADWTASISCPGEPELDRIAHAFNRWIARTRDARERASELETRLAHAHRVALLGTLAAEVAHEIRNPAGAMRLKAENALAGDASRQQSALRSILGQIERIEIQVSRLLALTQPVTPRVEPVDPATWLPESVQTHDEFARSKDVALTVACNMPTASAGEMTDRPVFDPAQMRRALDNLIVNSLAHVRPGGTVHIEASRRASPCGVRFVLEVADDGPGVAEAERARIFEPFVSARPGGCGLGLTLVREIAASHGGNAYHAATPTACFVLDIPWQPSC
ncbi:HAMP domain-containing histidine kinase [Burkholderia cenocepacia]|nr:HAMP domain-containing sensor histidine kinase [Burkholderia cenocepacia]ELK7724594.1 HAMP domain-containing histidine kinase [Burkholderia cenocepacia]MBR8310286.1 HAMP domain-containing histidine kinase [Burkholderia cenocepacia]MCA7967931.1 HAMP domain-containing histidine kinase [Burkholderia cenocepacia]MDR8029375.1 HAMP domain-containing histidine kinase [Burkholderia cenocepacia]MDR8039793.1 HAMP domain-containing histidine kinase [Burkholderia cenocepacia]